MDEKFLKWEKKRWMKDDYRSVCWIGGGGFWQRRKKRVGFLFPFCQKYNSFYFIFKLLL